MSAFAAEIVQRVSGQTDSLLRTIIFFTTNKKLMKAATFFLLPGHAKANSSCSTLQNFSRSGLTASHVLFSLGVLEMARLRRRASKKVCDLMTRPQDVGLTTTKEEEETISLLLEAFSQREKVTRERLEDAVGVIAINGVRAQRSRLRDGRKRKFRLNFGIFFFSNHAACVAVFPTFSMANHSCVSNASYAIHPSKDMRIELRTKVKTLTWHYPLVV